MPSITTLKKIILASGSETRFLMLKRAGIEFEQMKSKVDEDLIKTENPDFSAAELGLKLAALKALEISAQYPDAYVIGADQVCDFNGEFLDKPGTKEKCIVHLKKLAGQIHYQCCSTVIAHNNQIIWAEQKQAELKMRKLIETEIKAYVELENPLHSCGSYMFERNGKHLFEYVIGNDDVILGLALVELINQLYQLGAIELS